MITLPSGAFWRPCWDAWAIGFLKQLTAPKPSRSCGPIIPDLIIADVLMPTMDGYELVRQIRSDQQIALVPVIFFTAVYHESEARTLAESCGVQHVITKPAKPEVIRSVVNAALGAPSQPPVPMRVEEFDREHLRLLTDKLSQKANELEATNLRLRALVEVGQSLAGQRDPAQLLENLCGAARSIVGARHCIAGILARASWSFEWVPSWSFEWVQTSGFDQGGGVSLNEVPLDSGVLARLLAGVSPMNVKIPDSDPIGQRLPTPHGPERSFLGTSIRRVAQTYGILCLFEKLGAHEFSEEDCRIASALAAQAAIVCENIRRDEELRHSAEKLRTLAADLRSTREEERTRLSREVDNNMRRNVMALKANFSEHLRRVRAGAANAELLEHAASMDETLDRTISAVERISRELKPRWLDLGLVTAVEWYVQEFQTRSGIRCTLKTLEHVELDGERGVEVFQIVQQILTNAVHSGASTVEISILDKRDSYRIDVHDDGAEILSQEMADSRLPLAEMQQRARAIGAAIDIASDVGHGTTVRLTIPRARQEGVLRART